MKLKIATLVVLACAGGGASVALADHGGGNDQGNRHGARCHEVNLRGTLGAQSLTLTVTKANHKAATTGSTVAVALPAGARANVEACATVSGTSTTLTVREVEIQVKAPKATPPGTTGTGTVPNPAPPTTTA